MAPALVSPRRKSALASLERIKEQQRDQIDAECRYESLEAKDDFVADFEDTSDKEERPKKKLKNRMSNKNAPLPLDLLFSHVAEASKAACQPPARRHSPQYHRSLLLDGEGGQKARENLLTWFDSVSTTRSMPWRKEWVDPAKFDNEKELREALKRRAYEVWISEIMLQQTRVTTVISYWTNWMAKWPTIEDLARAEPEEVLSSWRGLGYYSRATRIHAAAKKVVEDEDMLGLLPETAEMLQSKVPGVGRYTGGAISSIVFGNAAPMVDGNVLRVLSRQLGVHGDVKTSKQVINLLWSTADHLVKAIATGESDEESRLLKKSDRPGRWGQALMELGSTICTPHPACRSCPVTQTCRVYAEGARLAAEEGLLSLPSGMKTPLADVEDLCALCEPFEESADSAAMGEKKTMRKRIPAKARQQQTLLSSFAFQTKGTARGTDKQPETGTQSSPSPKAMDIIEAHAKRFPLKFVKKAVREEETIVCVIRDGSGRFLLQQRPNKGLLAGLWEFPSLILPATNNSNQEDRKEQGFTFANSLLSSPPDIECLGEIESVPWLFSHLKLTMHVHFFTIKTSARLSGRWATSKQVEDESMGTGMRKCWSLVKQL